MTADATAWRVVLWVKSRARINSRLTLLWTPPLSMFESWSPDQPDLTAPCENGERSHPAQHATTLQMASPSNSLSWSNSSSLSSAFATSWSCPGRSALQNLPMLRCSFLRPEGDATVLESSLASLGSEAFGSKETSITSQRLVRENDTRSPSIIRHGPLEKGRMLFPSPRAVEIRDPPAS